MRKARIGLALLLACICAVAVPLHALAVPQVDSSAKVHDLAGILSAEDVADMEAQALELSDTHELDVALALVGEIDEGSNIVRYAESFYSTNGFGVGSDADGLLLVLNTTDRELYITTRGKGDRYFNDDFKDYMLDNIVLILREGSIADTMRTYLELAQDRLEAIAANPAILGSGPLEDLLGEEEDGQAETTAPSAARERGERDLFTLLWQGAVLALIVAVAVAAILVNLQKSGMPEAAGGARLYLEGEISVTDKQDTFLRTNTTRSAAAKDDEDARPARPKSASKDAQQKDKARSASRKRKDDGDDDY